MVRIGFSLSGEEHMPADLVRYGRRAEELGFDFLALSDHFHPWIGAQGQSPFVWSVIGGLAATTDRVEMMTLVTCPTMRIHPAIIAQAAATSAAMAPGRFTLGVGSGEALNEHILGEHWPPAEVRLERLDEAISIIRELWTGEEVTHYGDYYTVEQARLYTLPDEPPPILVAATGSRAASLAAENDGIVAVGPDPDLIAEFEEEAGQGKRKVGQLTVAWARDETTARQVAHRYWPQSALPKGVAWEIPTPAMFEALVENLTEEQAAAALVTCTDPEPIVAGVQEFIDAGFESVVIHQIGPDQLPFQEFFAAEVMPSLDRVAAHAGTG